MVQNVSDRFWSKVDKSGDCWVWIAALGRENNYGTYWLEGKQQPAHRVAYVLTYGPIMDGLKVLHKCDNKQCVRPDHLFLGTSKDNNVDCVIKGRHRNCAMTHPELLSRGSKNGLSNEARKLRGDYKTHCPQGHPYDESNTYINSRGGRKCKTCNRVKALAKLHQKKHASV